MPFQFKQVIGVDFSGARLAGRNIWLATCAVEPRSLRLVELCSLESLAGTAERGPALAHLVERVIASDRALWGMDFPFALPIEVMEDGCSWRDQLEVVRRFDGEAHAFGVDCLRRAQALGGVNHIRRVTDIEAKTPFDCYHYRIIYQTFHGMRDVLLPLSRSRGTAVLPFDMRRLSRARRAVVEACPGSTLKRLGLPHQNYKQPAGGALTRLRLRTRHAILAGIEPFATLEVRHRRRVLRNPGGDALDAVIAAIGAWQAWTRVDPHSVLRHPRYQREGLLYV
jgi:hypothetical protein